MTGSKGRIELDERRDFEIHVRGQYRHILPVARELLASQLLE